MERDEFRAVRFRAVGRTAPRRIGSENGRARLDFNVFRACPFRPRSLVRHGGSISVGSKVQTVVVRCERNRFVARVSHYLPLAGFLFADLPRTFRGWVGALFRAARATGQVRGRRDLHSLARTGLTRDTSRCRAASIRCGDCLSPLCPGRWPLGPLSISARRRGQEEG